MATLYTATSVSGYNANPPPDDGTTVATNLITWSGIKSKLGDPLNTFASSVDTNITSAFGKTLDGATVVATGVNYAATAADQGRLIKATASGITITTPDAATVTAPFMFSINNQSTGTITLAGNATGAQTIDGQTSQIIKSGSGCIIKTDGTNWFTFGLKAAQITSTNPPYGFDVPINLQLNASAASSLLTIAVKTNAGSDPTVSDPVLIPFRDSTLTGGDPVWVAITSALSINTNAAGATLGTQSSNIAFRLWVVAFNNAGTAVLALWHSGAGAAATAINQLNEGTLQSTTGISAAATSAGVFYTPNGTTLTSKAFRIIGYVDYASGLTTAGTYASAPTTVQLFGPGIAKPGHVIQTVMNTGSSSLSITPTSATNLVRASSFGWFNGSSSGAADVSSQSTLKRGATTLISQSAGGHATAASQAWLFPFAFTSFYDAPNTTSSTSYSIASAPSNLSGSYSGLSITLEEIMG